MTLNKRVNEFPMKICIFLLTSAFSLGTAFSAGVEKNTENINQEETLALLHSVVQKHGLVLSECLADAKVQALFDEGGVPKWVKDYEDVLGQASLLRFPGSCWWFFPRCFPFCKATRYWVSAGSAVD